MKGKLKLEQSLGLGKRPSVIPPAEANIHDVQRTVEIGWHPVAGFAGKWFAEKTGLGKKIAQKVNKYPDPTYVIFSPDIAVSPVTPRLTGG